MLEGLAMAALGLMTSAWCANRLFAVLLATALGMVWWISDFWSSVTTGGPGDWLRQLLPGLAEPVYAFAEGQAAWSLIWGYLVLISLFLLVARIGVRWRGRPLAIAITTLPLILTGGLALHLAQRAPGAIDLTWQGQHAVADSTRATVQELVDSGGLEAVFVATPGMRNNPVDGPLINRCRSLLQALTSSGLRVTFLDPSSAPATSAQLARQLDLSAADLSRPYVILRHDGRDEVLTAEKLGVVEERNGRRRLVAFAGEGSLLTTARRLRDGTLPRVAWLTAQAYGPTNATVRRMPMPASPAGEPVWSAMATTWLMSITGKPLLSLNRIASSLPGHKQTQPAPNCWP